MDDSVSNGPSVVQPPPMDSDKPSLFKRINKKIVGIVFLVLVIVAVPTTLYLVQQQQDVRQRAYFSYGNVGKQDNCRKIEVTEYSEDPLCPDVETNNVASHSATYVIKNITNESHTITYTTNTNFCEQGRGDQPGGECHRNSIPETGKTVTLTAGQSIPITMSRSSSYLNADGTPQACGSYQTDLIIDSVDGNTNCKTPLLTASLCKTGKTCIPITPTITPPQTPTPTPTICPTPGDVPNIKVTCPNCPPESQ